MKAVRVWLNWPSMITAASTPMRSVETFCSMVNRRSFSGLPAAVRR
jgi:hypothetical protein